MTRGSGPMMAMRTQVVKPKDFNKTVKRLIQFYVRLSLAKCSWSS